MVSPPLAPTTPAPPPPPPPPPPHPRRLPWHNRPDARPRHAGQDLTCRHGQLVDDLAQLRHPHRPSRPARVHTPGPATPTLPDLVRMSTTPNDFHHPSVPPTPPGHPFIRTYRPSRAVVG